MKIIELIAEELNLPISLMEKALDNARKIVKHIEIPKKDGNFRKVYQPSKKLKIIQYWLINNVFMRMRISESATAYRENLSVKNNAYIHQKNKYFVKLDFVDFFPSIIYRDLEPLIEAWHKDEDPKWQWTLINKETIRKTCFYKRNKLPIGYPSSPIISNIIMYDFDIAINSTLYLRKDILGNVKYSRYADDLIFSTNKKGVYKEIIDIVNTQIRSMKSPKLKLNSNKTKICSKSGGSALITGLRICNDGHMTIHRKYKDRVRLLISLFEKGKLNSEDIPKLRGHFNYIKNVDPSFYTKMQKKHFKILKRL